ncbi:MAG TPA: universal stress protein [Gemmatimonadaceae bacterium]|nr:universal stress protein [Gemmatimonadaceae bacterium]
MPDELRRVAVGIDFSETSLASARWTARHLAPGAELVLIHAVYVPEPPGFLRGRYPPIEQLVTNAQRGAEQRMGELAVSLGSARVRTEVRVGRPAEVVAEAARAMEAELIVAGAHGERSGVWKMLGSTAQQILESSGLPVLLARSHGDNPPRRILLPLDDSAASALAADWSAMLGRHRDAEIVALHVLNPMLHGAAGLAGSAPERRRAYEQLQQSGREWIETLLGEHGIDPARASVEIAIGDPGFEILAAARRSNTDLIVMGRRGSGVTRLLVGSVTDYVVRSGGVSVLVVSSGEAG